MVCTKVVILALLISTPSNSFLKIGKKQESLHSEKDIGREVQFKLYEQLQNINKGILNVKKLIRYANNLEERDDDYVDSINNLNTDEYERKSIFMKNPRKKSNNKKRTILSITYQ